MKSVLSLLDHQQTDKLFPFHLALDHNLVIKSHGAGFMAITGDIQGYLFSQVLSLPGNNRPTAKDIQLLLDSIVEIAIKRSKIYLSGMLMHDQATDTFIFLGNIRAPKAPTKNRRRAKLSAPTLNKSKLTRIDSGKSESATNADQDWVSGLVAAANASSDLLVLMNAAGETDLVNQCFIDTTGYSIDEVMGQTPTSYLNVAGTDAVQLAAMKKAISSGLEFQGTLLCHTKAGVPFWNETSLKPVKSKAGHVTKYILIARDITERIKKTEDLLYSELRWKFAMSESGEGYFEYDIANGKFYGSDSLLKALGIHAETDNIDFRSLVGIIHPQDDKAAVNALFDLISGKTTSLKHELRLKDADGIFKWMLIKATVTKTGSDGMPTSLIGTTTDITNIKQTELALIKAKKEAEKASAYKNQFLATMSHEIRTPLNAIIGLTNLMLMNQPTGKLKEDLNILSFSSNQLLSLINDVLDLSKIESGKIDFTKSQFNLNETIETIYLPFVAKCREKGIALNVNMDPAIPKALIGDPFRLAQILNNLIGNAVKFTNHGSLDVNVKLVSLTGKQARLMFDVADTGIGMSKATQKKIFNDFAQANANIAHQFGGTGLGLAITKKLVNLQGGQIKVESQLNKGSRFYFELTFDIAETYQRTLPTKGSGIQTPQQLKGIKVLLVEDNIVNQKVAMSYLNHWDAEVLCASNGMEAIELFKKHRFDILLVDLYMPVMNGFDAIRKIRKTIRGKHSKIIALTASADSNTIQQAIDCGADGCLGKPFNVNHLFETISSLISSNAISKASTTKLSTRPNKLKYIDLQKLQDASLGSPTFVKDMIELLKREIPAAINDSQRDLDSKDYHQFSQSIHKLKNSLLMFGFDHLSSDLSLLQENAKSNKNLAQIPRLFNKTVKNWKRAEKELRTL